MRAVAATEQLRADLRAGQEAAGEAMGARNEGCAPAVLRDIPERDEDFCGAVAWEVVVRGCRVIVVPESVAEFVGLARAQDVPCQPPAQLHRAVVPPVHARRIHLVIVQPARARDVLHHRHKLRVVRQIHEHVIQLHEIWDAVGEAIPIPGCQCGVELGAVARLGLQPGIARPLKRRALEQAAQADEAVVPEELQRGRGALGGEAVGQGQGLGGCKLNHKQSVKMDYQKHRQSAYNRRRSQSGVNL